ncbi:Ribosomal RNA adenine methylase transferase [Niveomyces insectorum RCEF 264]|uniref:rRNA adenine N(6)-methyltransferase n=1 Tax=Niveomyces insectorum RCEF 264 TaxID=1081102 RepID=A0A167MV41_9HYPO|nr:Ribosomal RNA adenine methylase transferase [Niveomyces insectorum RCEF 264]
MGKLKTLRKGGSAAAASSPYARPGGKAGKAGSGAAKNNVFKFNTNVGQHILKNPGVADAKAESRVLRPSLKLKPTDIVLEIGPGTGNITTRILDKARKCIAIELDPRMAAEVTKRVQGSPQQKKLEVLLGDAIKTEFPPFDVCISNTPYQISSPLVFKLLALPNPPRTAILMFQKEFAQRLVARPGDALYCRLSVNAQFFARITHVLKVGKANFKPPPQVESAVVRIVPKTGAERPKFNFAEMDGMLRIVFTRKNRTLRASFASKEVLALLVRNYRVYASLNGVAVDDSVVEAAADEDNEDDNDDDDLGGGMDVDDDEEEAAGAALASPPGATTNGPTTGGDDEEWNGIGMDVEDDDDDMPAFFKELNTPRPAPPPTPSRRARTKVDELVRAKVLRVLDALGLASQRARQCDEHDFLRLLDAMNHEGIHFS